MTIFDQWLQGIRPAIATLLDLRLVATSEDRAVVEMDAGARYANPMGTLHGGILCDLADAAMGSAWGSGLSDSETFTTVELKINFFRPVWDSKLIAEARVVRRGRTMGYVECDVHDDRKRLVARAACTCMTLRGKDASGR